MKNKYGFSMIGLLIVVIIIGLLALAAFRLFNTEAEELGNNNINEMLPEVERAAIMGYVKAIEVEVVMAQMTTENLSICVGLGPALNCSIDATVEGRNNPAKSTSNRVVNYSGEGIICESGSIDKLGRVNLYSCRVGESLAVYNVSNGVID